jgi:maleate isomerase
MSQASIRAIDYGDRLQAGVLIPSGNSVAEPELRAMLPPGSSMLVTRLPLRGSSTIELTQMIERLEAASELLADACVDVIVFHCTAVSTFAPDLAHGIRERIERASGIRCFTTADAILAALSKLNAKRVSLLTPYIDEVHTREIGWLEANGVHVDGGASLGINTNIDMAKLEPEEILSWARENISEAADACFLSCTAIKSAAIIEPLERLCGRPVLTSNQSMIWHLLRSSQILDSVEGFGQLFESSRSESGREAVGVTMSPDLISRTVRAS